MKKILIFMILVLFFGAGKVFSQGKIRKLIVEADSSLYANELIIGPCRGTISGQIIFITNFPNLKIELVANKSCLLDTVSYDPDMKRYVLCLKPNDTFAGGIVMYKIDIKAGGDYTPYTLEVKNVRANGVQFFTVNPEEAPEPTVKQEALTLSDIFGISPKTNNPELTVMQEDIKRLQRENAELKKKDSLILAQNTDKINTLLETAKKKEEPILKEEKVLETTKLITITGTVRNKDYRMAGVVVKGASRTMFTDEDGKYSISVPENSTLVFSFSGYKQAEMPVNGKTNIDVLMKQKQNIFSGLKELGFGLTGDFVWNIPSLKNQNGTIDLDEDITDEKHVSNFGWKAGFSLLYPKSNATEWGNGHISFFTGVNFGNIGFNFNDSDGKIKDRLSSYTISVPAQFIFGSRGFFKIGVDNNFNIKSKYTNNMLGTHISDASGNRMLKNYTLDGVVGTGFMLLGDDDVIPLVMTLLYSRSLINQLNPNYVLNLNGMEYKPFEHTKYYNNLFTISFTWFFGGQNY